MWVAITAPPTSEKACCLGASSLDSTRRPAAEREDVR